MPYSIVPQPPELRSIAPAGLLAVQIDAGHLVTEMFDNDARMSSVKFTLSDVEKFRVRCGLDPIYEVIIANNDDLSYIRETLIRCLNEGADGDYEDIDNIRRSYVEDFIGPINIALGREVDDLL